MAGGLNHANDNVLRVRFNYVSKTHVVRKKGYTAKLKTVGVELTRP